MRIDTAAGYGGAVVDRIARVPQGRDVEQGLGRPDVFGPAYVRESGQRGGGAASLYGPDARLVDEDALSDAATVRSLEQRDREVRRKEEGKGEAVGSSNYIYQMGPDGERYAIGTAAHAVREDGDGEEGASGTRAPDGARLSDADEELVRRLEARDAKVRSHEAAHVMAAGGQAGMPDYTYQTGPDGQQYAVGGSVSISMLATGDEAQTARQAQKAYRAAMATGEPSAQDMKTAAMALARMRQQSGQDFTDPGVNLMV